VREVRDRLDIPGVPGQLDPNRQALHSVREAIDGMMEAEKSTKVIQHSLMIRM
jgi:hypothetical protein